MEFEYIKVGESTFVFPSDSKAYNGDNIYINQIKTKKPLQKIQCAYVLGNNHTLVSRALGKLSKEIVAELVQGRTLDDAIRACEQVMSDVFIEQRKERRLAK